MPRLLSTALATLKDCVMIAVAFVFSVIVAGVLVTSFTASVLLVSLAAALHGAWENAWAKLKLNRKKR